MSCRMRIAAASASDADSGLSGADCPWTQVAGAKIWHCRRNGRLYRLSQPDGRRWILHRVGVLNAKPGREIGRYESRSAASKIVASVAYQPDLV